MLGEHLDIVGKLRAVAELDLGDRTNKKKMWAILSVVDSMWGIKQNGLRDGYMRQGMSVDQANSRAVLDIANELGGKLKPVAGKKAKAGATELEKLDELTRRVKELTGYKRVALAKIVPWVSANIRVRPEELDPEEVPGLDALGLLIWAQGNPTEYRKLYDCRRISTKGLAEDEEKGFMDGGEPIDNIISRIRNATNDDHVPDLRAEEEVSGDRIEEDSVHRLPGPDGQQGEAARPREQKPGTGIGVVAGQDDGGSGTGVLPGGPKGSHRKQGAGHGVPVGFDEAGPDAESPFEEARTRTAP